MGTTSKGLRYPENTNAPNVPQDIQNLANDVNTALPNGWTNLAAGNTSYNYALTGSYTTPPGMSGSVTVPSGRTLDVEFHCPSIHLTGAVAFAELLIGGTAVDSALYSIGTGDCWMPMRLSGSVVGTGASVAVSVQAYVSSGSASVVAGNAATGPVIRYRIV